MSTVNSFGTRKDLDVGGSTFQIYSLAALEAAGFPEVARLPFSLKILLENLLRHEDGRFVKAVGHRGAGALGRPRHGAEGNLLRAGARAAPGLYRRAGGRRSGGHARRHRAPRRRPEPGQSAAAGRARDRSLGAGRLLRSNRRVSAECGARVFAQQRALRLPPLGSERLPQFPRRAARHRHRSSGQPRISRARRGVERRRPERHARVPGHARRHRLAHDDDQRAGRRRLGRRRHRSRSRDARPADLDAHSAGARLPSDRHDARRRDRHRSGVDHHRAAAQARRRRQVRRVLRHRSRAPDHCRSRDARQHVPGVRRDDRDLPDRRDDARLSAPEWPRRVARAAGRSLRQGAGAVPPGQRSRSGVLRGHRARSVHGRAEPGGSPSSAGPRVAQAGEERLPVRIVLARRRGEEGRFGRGGERDRDGGGRTAGRRRSARSRLGGHRRDHQLHEHLEPERHDRRRPGRQEGGRARPVEPAVGEDESGAGIEGRHRVSAQGGPDAVSRSARLQSGRLRLHHLHRQQRAAARRRRRRGRGEEPGGRVGPERQPELRRSNPAGRARQLPGLAAARRRLRARREDDHRPHHRAARHRQRRQAGLPARHLADRARDSGDDAEGGHRRLVPRAVQGRVQRRQPLAVARSAGRRSLRLGARLDLHPQSAVLRRADARSRRRSTTSPAPAPWRCSATASRPTTFRRPARSRKTVRPASI